MSKIKGDINREMMRNACTRAINAPALELIADILEQHTNGVLAGIREHMDKRKAIKADAAGFDAADMATAAAQGFRDGVASVSAGSEPVAAEESRLYGDAKLAHNQCRAVVHLAHMLAEVYQANALILAAGQGPVEIIGQASAEVMEILGDIINSTDAMDEDDLWLDQIYDAAQARWPAERAAAPGPADGESNGN